MRKKGNTVESGGFETTERSTLGSELKGARCMGTAAESKGTNGRKKDRAEKGGESRRIRNDSERGPRRSLTLSRKKKEDRKEGP